MSLSVDSLVVLLLATAAPGPREAPEFRHHFGDRAMPISAALGQTDLADLDRDGDLDFIVGRRGGDVYWYEYRSADDWEPHRLGGDSPSDVGGKALDVDGDGWIDFVAGGAWYRNPGPPGGREFERFVFDPDLAAVHDVAIGDLDGDGRPDVATMSDKGDLRWYAIPADDPTGRWGATTIGPGVHAGLSLGDVDGDGDLDAVRSDLWFENRDGRGGAWADHRMSEPWGNRSMSFTYDATRTAVVDLDGDGSAEVVVAENEIPGGRIGWLEPPDDGPASGPWAFHPLPTGGGPIRGPYHSLCVADFDGDGDPDVASAEMEHLDVRVEGLPRWFLWENRDGRGRDWVEHVILDANLGGHELACGDVDGDGDPDLCAKPWRPSPRNAVGGGAHFSYLENRRIAGRGRAGPRDRSLDEGGK